MIICSESLNRCLVSGGLAISGAVFAKEASESTRKKNKSGSVLSAGADQPVAETDSYLEKVAGIMKDRPEINIKICGLAVAADRIAMGGAVAADAKDKSNASDKVAALVTDEHLLELATKRAAFVKDRLVIKYGAPASRLVACTPEIDTAEADENVARVDLLI